VLSTCKAPDQPGEGVLLHYSYDNGITWKLLEHYSYLNYHEPRYMHKYYKDCYLLSVNAGSGSHCNAENKYTCPHGAGTSGVKIFYCTLKVTSFP